MTIVQEIALQFKPRLTQNENSDGAIFDTLSACFAELWSKGYSNTDPTAFNEYSETVSLLCDVTKKAGDNLEARKRAFESVQRIDPRLATLIGEVIGNNSPAPRRFNPFTVNKILDLPRKVWLVQDVIGAGDTTMFFGESGAGKSFVVHDFIFSSILGRNFADHFHIARPLKIAYATGEGQSGLSTRFRELIAKYNANIEEISLRLEVYGITESPPQLFDDKSEYEYETFVRELKQSGFVPDVLILDTYHNVTVGANENDARDTGVILAAVNYIKQHLGCAVLIVHHTNKMGLVERGSGALRAACDTIILVREEKGGGRVMECSKQKDGKKWSKSEARRFTLKSFSETKDGVAVQWLGEMGIDPDDTISAREQAVGRMRDAIDALEAASMPFKSHNGGWVEMGVVLTTLNLAAAQSGGAYKTMESNQLGTLLKKCADTGLIERSTKDPSQIHNSKTNPYVFRPKQIDVPSKESVSDDGIVL